MSERTRALPVVALGAKGRAQISPPPASHPPPPTPTSTPTRTHVPHPTHPHTHAHFKTNSKCCTLPVIYISIAGQHPWKYHTRGSQAHYGDQVPGFKLALQNHCANLSSENVLEFVDGQTSQYQNRTTRFIDGF